jgi:hypothetical protein
MAVATKEWKQLGFVFSTALRRHGSFTAAPVIACTAEAIPVSLFRFQGAMRVVGFQPQNARSFRHLGQMKL